MSKRNGSVIWITGLSGSGKSTLAGELLEAIIQHGLGPTVVLDGDELRHVFLENEVGKEGAYSKEARVTLGLKYSRLSKLLASQGVNVIVATISLFREVNTWNRENIEHYVEVLIDLPIEILMNRDPKHIYKEYLAGKRLNVAGLDLSVDWPESPDIRLNEFDIAEKSQVLKSIIKLIK